MALCDNRRTDEVAIRSRGKQCTEHPIALALGSGCISAEYAGKENNVSEKIINYSKRKEEEMSQIW